MNDPRYGSRDDDTASNKSICIVKSSLSNDQHP